MIVRDTNVISELMRPEPAPAVVAWLASCPPMSVFTTAITEAEIPLGLALPDGGRRRDALTAAAQGLFSEDLAGRVLPFDSAAAGAFADIVATRRRSGRPISHADAQIAAIATSRDATVATRNTVDFQHCGVRVVDTWRR